MADIMRTSEENGVTIVEFADETRLDGLAVDQIRDQLTALVEEGGPSRILMDCAALEFLSSQALGLLVTLRIKAARSETRVVLANVPEILMDIVTLTQVDRLYEILPTREEAMAALHA